MTSMASRTTSYSAETPPSRHSFENGRMNETRGDVAKKRERKRKEKSSYSLQNTSNCPLCVRLLKKTKHSLKNWEREKPVAVLSIIGETKTYFPNETIKTQLKSGLLELMNTTNIWIITEGQDTCIGQIVEEVIRENTDKSQSCCCHKDDILQAQTRNKNGTTILQTLEGNLEVCIKEHLSIPLIVMLVGGEEGSFEAALVNLKRSVPILVIDGSGKAADFICKGSRMGMNISSAEFQSELIHAAQMLYGSNDEKANTIQTKCEKIIKQLQDEMAEHWKSIHVYSVYETTYTLDKTIQDILFDVFYLGLITILAFVFYELFKSFIKLNSNILHCIYEESIHFTKKYEIQYSYKNFLLYLHPKFTYIIFKISVLTH